MERLVRVKEVGLKFEVYQRGFVRSPATLNLNEAQLERLVNMFRGPKQIYFVNPANMTEEVKVTLENLRDPIEKLFPAKVKEEKPAETATLTLDDIKPEETFAKAAEEAETVAEPEKVEEEEKPAEPVKEEKPVETQQKQYNNKQYYNNKKHYNNNNQNN